MYMRPARRSFGVHFRDSENHLKNIHVSYVIHVSFFLERKSFFVIFSHRILFTLFDSPRSKRLSRSTIQYTLNHRLSTCGRERLYDDP